MLNLTDISVLFGHHGFLSFDTETTGLMPFHGDKIFAMSFYDGKNAFYIDQEYNLEHLARIFSDPYKKWYLANPKFDMHFLKKQFGLEIVGPVYDVLTLARLVYNDHLSYSLAACAERAGLKKLDTVEEYIKEHNLWSWKDIPGKKVRKKDKRYQDVPREILKEYACVDAEITYKLGELYLRELKEKDALLPSAPKASELAKLESRVTKVIFDVEYQGVCLDLEYSKKAFDFYESDRKVAEEKFKELTGVEYKSSPKLFAEIFQSDKNKWKYTEKGNPSFDSDVLSEFSNPAAKELLRIRNCKARADFFAGFLYYADSSDIIHPSFNQNGTASGRFSSSEPNCLSIDTEILTANGWKNFSTLLEEDKIFCYSIKTKKITLERYITKYTSGIARQKFITAKNSHLDIKVTDKHRMLFKNRKNGEFVTVSAENFRKDSKILHGAHFDSGCVSIAYNKIKFSVAVQADAYVATGMDGRLQITFCFSKERKIVRLRSILDSLKIEYREKFHPRRNVTSFYISLPGDYFYGILSGKKEFSTGLLNLTSACRNIFLKELNKWDGVSTRVPLCYFSKSTSNVALVQALVSLSGGRSKVSHYKNSTGGRVYICYGTDRDYSLTANIKLKAVDEYAKVWCVKVPTGYFIARRNGTVYIVGNCQNLTNDDEATEEPMPVRKALIPPNNDFCIVSMDYDQQEYRMLLEYAQEKKIIDQVLSGTDVHQAAANMMGVTRKYAKTLNFMLLYGGGADKLASSLGISSDKAKELKSLYFKNLPGVENFISRVINTARLRGYVYNWYGRRFASTYDFAYKMPNRIIQGGGADVMKLALVRIHDLLKEYKSSIFLTVHDELDFYIHKEEFDLIPRIKKIMEEVYPSKLLPLTVSISHSWNNLGELNEGPPDILS